MTRVRGLLLLLSLLALGAAAGALASGVRRATTTKMYGRRYCEYLVVKGRLPKLTANVWNTYGLNACPERLWRKSNASAMAKQLNALTVALNGPRYWLMDSARITLPPPLGQVQQFASGLRARLVATLDVPIHNGVPGNTPYHDVTVNRTNTFTWSHRHPVYELVSAQGRVYVMQSYSQIMDPHLKLSDLPGLGAQLHPPAGWHFRRRLLTHDLTLTARGKVTVIQDDLADTYQLAPR